MTRSSYGGKPMFYRSNSTRPMRTLVSSCWAVGAAAVLAPQVMARDITTQVEEVTVTAQKREENIQDVPISVSAYDAQAIERAIVRDVQDVQDISPNIMIDPILGNGTISFMSRGINMDDVEQSFDPAVGVVIDGLFLGTATGALVHLWDAERVEMLRGPQGTLFGKNTIGGVLNIRRTRPRGEWGGKFAITAGSDGKNDYKGVLHLPALLNGTLSTKITAVSLHGGHYFNNIARAGSDEGGENFNGYGFAALWEPRDNMELLVSYNYDKSNTDTRPVTSLSVSRNNNPDAAIGIGGQPACAFEPLSCDHPYTDDDFHRTSRTTRHQPASLETHTVIAEAKWRINDLHELVSVTGYREFEEEAIQEFDGYTFDLFYTNRPQKNEQLSQELRWHSNWTENITSVLGFFYWDREYELNQRTFFTPLFFGLPPGPAIEVPNGFDQIQETESWAIFGQVDYRVLDHWVLSFGGRYIEEEKDTCGGIAIGPNNARIYDPAVVAGTGLYGNCAGRRPATAIANSSNFYTDPNTGALIPQTGKMEWDDFSPRAAISYEFDNGNLLYASYTEGWRSGGFNGRSTNAFDHGPYDPEEVSSIELGLKSRWLDNRLQFNISGFFTTYDDKQEEVVFPALGGAGTVTIVENVQETKIDGVELDAHWVPVDGLTLNFNYGYLDARFEDYEIPFLSGGCTVADPCSQVGIIDKAHFELRRAPEHNFAVGGMYEYQVADNVFLITKLNYRWRDDYFTTTNNSVESFVESFGIVDASVHLEWGDNWRVSMYGKNLTNEEYLLHALDVGTTFAPASSLAPGTAPPGFSGNQAVRTSLGTWSFGTISPPRQFGLEVQYSF